MTAQHVVLTTFSRFTRQALFDARRADALLRTRPLHRADSAAAARAPPTSANLQTNGVCPAIRESFTQLQ
ncbi:hypothetical protein [Burkholderia multivorans]|uniref:hypothetical protein n=1 Tax=Burkholderia multivorans TaxID=87883 RepID=UPI0021C1D142|nr:hypothetical protein [Burkholderia multivorans]